MHGAPSTKFTLNNDTITNMDEIVKEFNTYFISIGRTLSDQIHSTHSSLDYLPQDKQDAREAMRVVFSVLTKRICMHKTKFLMNIFKYCLKIILNCMNLQIATQLIIMFNF